MQFLKFFIAGAVLALGAHSPAWARGGSDGGGGNGEDGEIIEATYRPTDRLPGYKKYVDVRNFVASVVPNFAYRMDKFAMALEWTLVAQDLPYRGNDIDYLVPSQQTAVQHDGLVYVDTRITGKAKFKTSWPMLITHEVLLRILLARNAQFKLGLTEAQIHKNVRTVVFRLFDYASRPRPDMYDIATRELLFNNGFGYFAYKIWQDKARAQLPEAIQKMSAYVDDACRSGKSQLVDEDLRKLHELEFKFCNNCGYAEINSIHTLWSMTSESKPLEGKYFPPVHDGQILTAIHLTPQTCASAKKYGAAVPDAKSLNGEISWITNCANSTAIVPGDNSCDFEEVPPGVSGQAWVRVE